MEPQGCYDNKKTCKKRNCLGIISVILLTAFIFVVGLLVGAAISEAILAALSAIIVLAVILGLLFILSAILMFCCKKEKKCC